MLALGKAAARNGGGRRGALIRAVRGVAVVPHGVEAGLERIELLHAGHPIPDEASVAAAERLLALAADAGPDDLVLVLLSGGASALACLPGRPVAHREAGADRGLAPLRRVDRRDQLRPPPLSGIKGGRLRATLTLAIADAVGDRPEDIGSGPTVADPTTVAQARAILDRYGLAAPLSETAKRAEGEFRIVAGAADALAAAAAEAERLGYRPVLLGAVEGEAREIGRDHARLALRGGARLGA